MKKSKETLNSKFSVLNSPFSTILVIILAGIPFVMGRYFEFNYPDPFDSAANVYSAQHILNGAKIGIDENPSAATGTLLVNILGCRLFGFSEFGPKLIQTIMQAIALVAAFIAMRKAFGNLAAIVGVTVASIYLSSPLLAKFGNVKEQYAIACMVTAVSLLILRQLDGKWWCSILAGAAAIWCSFQRNGDLGNRGDRIVCNRAADIPPQELETGGYRYCASFGGSGGGDGSGVYLDNRMEGSDAAALFICVGNAFGIYPFLFCLRRSSAGNQLCFGYKKCNAFFGAMAEGAAILSRFVFAGFAGRRFNRRKNRENNSQPAQQTTCPRRQTGL